MQEQIKELLFVDGWRYGFPDDVGGPGNRS